MWGKVGNRGGEWSGERKEEEKIRRWIIREDGSEAVQEVDRVDRLGGWSRHVSSVGREWGRLSGRSKRSDEN